MATENYILMNQGFSIGYNHPLAEVGAPVALGDGTHYLLARNGRGKTTLLRTLAGVLKSLSGQFKIDGCLQFVPEDIEFNDHLNSKVLFKALLPKDRFDACVGFADSIELDLNMSYRSLSTGNKRKVSWLLAEFSVVEGQNNIVLLDEPFTGLDSYTREKIMEYWGENSDGICRLVSCHPDFDSMCIGSAVLISEGQLSHSASQELASWGELKKQLV
ncbi:ATP-binding cassette domain-containing protein [Rubritalea marina]|uniref:ATP-binding cassette domain-containing protein n=1 Tax=Rubritalea marina TaxID=361055 RepID=UPI00036EB094|nr:ATP-binding cassette domain-containing protein [Rubritalea marina]